MEIKNKRDKEAAELVAYLYFYSYLQIGIAEKHVGKQFLIDYKLKEMNEAEKKLQESRNDDFYVFNPIHKIYLKEKEAILGTNGKPYFTSKEDNELTKNLINENYPSLLEGIMMIPECCIEKKPDFFAFHYTNIVNSAAKNRTLGFKYHNQKIIEFYETIKKNLGN